MRYSFETVVTHLKQALKKRGISYLELAERLGLSESGVKKIMTNHDVSMARLSEICEAAEIDLLDLLEVAWKSPPVPYFLTEEQHDLFAANPEVYDFHIALLNARLDVEAVKADYELDRRSITLYLGALEDVGLIEQLPGGRVRSMVPAPYRMGGTPKAITDKKVMRYLEHTLGLPKDQRHQLAANLRMTKDHFEGFKKAVHEVVLRYGVMAHQDELTNRDDDLVGVGVLTAIAVCERADYERIPRITRKPRA